MIKRSVRFIKNLSQLFTGELTLGEVEKLFRDDTRGMYAFFIRNMPPRDPAIPKWKRGILFAEHLLVVFLKKLTPARRFLFGCSIILFFLILLDPNLSNTPLGLDTGFAVLALFAILTFLLALELSDKLITRDELSVARDIQVSLLPQSLFPFGNFQISAYSEVARSVGGDYYDCLELADGSKLIVVADVSGKGISAALYTVKVQTTLQLLVRETADVRELMVQLNRQLFGTLKKNYFLTISLLKLLPDGSIECCRAGHTPAILLRQANGVVEKLRPKGTAVGLAPSHPAVYAGNVQEKGDRFHFDESLEVERRSLEWGDTLALFTDGVVEMVNRRQEEFGEHRLVSVLMEQSRRTPEEAREELVRRLTQFREGAELRDDVTVVIIKYL
ncbi:MAG TPA: SpoIIE family protein phosphatase [Bacteroidota bacterium]|nr:SpoIIE family protein phosphatase [Bacteroidota bacterium]